MSSSPSTTCTSTFDPVCPFAWMTSKWVRMVAAQRDYRVDWRFISLRILNANVDYATHFPPSTTRTGTPRACGCCGSPRGCAASTGGPRSSRSTAAIGAPTVRHAA